MSNPETDILTDLRPSKTTEVKESFYGTSLFWSAVSSPFLFAFLFLFFSKRKENNADEIEIKQDIKKKDVEINQLMHLIESNLKSNEDVLFFTSVEAALKKAFAKDLKLTEERIISKNEIFDHIKANYASELGLKVNAIFNDCEQSRYGFGATNQNKELIFQELKTVLKSLKS